MTMLPGESFRDFVERMHTRAQDQAIAVRNGELDLGPWTMAPDGTYQNPADQIGKAEADAIRAEADRLGIPLQVDGQSFIGMSKAVNDHLYGAGNYSDAWTSPIPDGPDYRGPEGDQREFQGVRDFLIGAGLNLVVPGLGPLIGEAGVKAINTARDVSAISDLFGGGGGGGGVDAAREMAFAGGQNAQGGMVDLMEPEAPDISSPLEGLLGGRGDFSIRVPGLPFPIPGNMSWEDLLDTAADIAEATGETIQSVLDRMGGSEPEIAQGGAQEPSGGATGDLNEEDEQLSTGQPWWWESGDTDAIPGEIEEVEVQMPGMEPSGPPVSPPELEEAEVQVPGVSPAEGDSGAFPGLAAGALLGLGLIPMFSQPDRSSLRPGRTLMQANESRLSDRPDYGDPVSYDLFQFGDRVSQPTQVGYDPDPRQETLTAAERERLRRLRRQGMI